MIPLISSDLNRIFTPEMNISLELNGARGRYVDHSLLLFMVSFSNLNGSIKSCRFIINWGGQWSEKRGEYRIVIHLNVNVVSMIY